MIAKITEEDAAVRRETVLKAARWCFLTFGFAKTSLDDIAKRAGISRTLLYRTFKGKEDIFTAVFSHWLIARHPDAHAAVMGKGNVLERLLELCRIMVVEPWADMVGAPMAGEFELVCERIDPSITKLHNQVFLDCVVELLDDVPISQVFLLALEGQVSDQPTVPVLEDRIRILAGRFVKPAA